MDKKFLSPQEIIMERERKISKFLDSEVGDKTIYGWQLIVRKNDDAAIAKSVYIRGLGKMVRRQSGDKNEILLDSFLGTTEWVDERAGEARVEISFKDDLEALKAFNEQQRFEINGNHKVYFDCGVASCSREGRTLLGTSLQKALELTPNPECRSVDIKAIINSLDYERNIHTIGDLICFERDEIVGLRNLGPKRMKMLDMTLEHYHTEWKALKRPRKVMNGSVILELQVVVKNKNL